MAQAGLNYKKNWQAKISLDCPFKRKLFLKYKILISDDIFCELWPFLFFRCMLLLMLLVLLLKLFYNLHGAGIRTLDSATADRCLTNQ